MLLPPQKISEHSLLGRRAFLIERERGRRILLRNRGYWSRAQHSLHPKCRSVINFRRLISFPSGPGG